jgi:general secretion pathway protein D
MMRRVRAFCHVLLSFLALTASACQTIDESPTVKTWRPAPLARADAGSTRPRNTTGAPLLADRPAASPTIIEGTGRFVGAPSPPGQASATDGAGDGVTINLVNVPAPQAAKTVLGDILGVKYTVDPGIEGKITIQTPAPVTRLAAVDLFQSALRSNGAAVVNSNGTYKIVPADQAPVGAVISTGAAPEAGGKLGSGLQVVSLKYVAASEMKRILEPMAPRGAIVRADDARHAITLSGNSAEIAGLMEAISIFDVDVMRGMSFALVPVKISDPGAIADELKTVFASERDGPMADMVQFLPNKRLGAILVISPQRGYLDRAAQWVRRLDAQAAGSEKQFFTYSVQNRRASELVDVLQSMLPGETGSRGAAPRNVAPPYREASVQSGGAPQGMSQSFASLGGGGTGMMGGAPQGMGGGGGMPQGGLGQGGMGMAQPRMQQAAAPSASRGGATIQSRRDEATGEPRIKVAADEAKNAILIEASPADYRRIMRVIGTLDVMPNQVLLEATIAEVTLNDDLKFGVRWQLLSSDAKSSHTFSDAASGSLASVFPGFSYAVTATNIAGSLNALNQITDVNIISSPSLTVMDNKTALLQIGDQVPITTSSAVNVLGGGGAGFPIVNSISYRDTGVILAMTPRINQSGRVLLDIEQEVSSVAPTTSSGIDSPSFRQRRLRTSVAVANNETLVLGGLIQDSKTESRTQVPILGDLPLIGNAFKQKGNTIGKTELVIMITPHVMRGVSEARRVSDEFRRELSIVLPPAERQLRNLGGTVRRTLE